MKHNIVLMVLIQSLFGGLYADVIEKVLDNDINIAVQAQKSKKVSIGIVVLGEQKDTKDQFEKLKECVERLVKDLQWSGQVKVVVKQCDALHHHNDLKNMFDRDVSIAVLISLTGTHFTWRLYDVHAVHMIAGKQVAQNNLSVAMIAHKIADELWPELFSQPSSFRSKIAYCKEIWRFKFGHEKPYKQVWICDFDGSNPQLFIDAPTISFAPRWNSDPDCPLLFYSQNTLSNVQLVMSNMFGKSQVLSSFDGLNMQPAFSSDGKKVVFCLSKDGTSQLYLSGLHHLSKHRMMERLTFNDGNNLSPCFVDDGHIAFVSDYKDDKPQIFMLDLATKVVKQITQGAYCVCPSYSKVRRQLVYSKMMGGGMQLFLYDIASGQHKQLTFDAGSKEEASWSPCGNYITFGLNQGYHSRISQLCLPTNIIKHLTDAKDNCTYPDCSPIYQDYLGVLVK